MGVGTDLSGAKLNNAILREANLDGAILDGANLFGASLCNANRSRAGLAGADLHNADLIVACVDCSGHLFGKEAHCVVCGDQEAGRGSCGTEPEEPTERQSSG